jgi:predicted Fe-S protein YdhL (DUF1289 family)
MNENEPKKIDREKLEQLEWMRRDPESIRQAVLIEIEAELERRIEEYKKSRKARNLTPG